MAEDARSQPLTVNLCVLSMVEGGHKDTGERENGQKKTSHIITEGSDYNKARPSQVGEDRMIISYGLVDLPCPN